MGPVGALKLNVARTGGGIDGTGYIGCGGTRAPPAPAVPPGDGLPAFSFGVRLDSARIQYLILQRFF